MSFVKCCSTRVARAAGVCLVLALMVTAVMAQGVNTTTVEGTVYLANGSPASGTLQLSWPAFTTASSQAVAAGKLSVDIGADGFVSVSLAPNLGSSPAGLFYTAIYHLNDGTTNVEYWTVPSVAQTSIAQVRSQLMPAAQAVQAVSKAYVDQAVQSVAQGNLTSTGGQLTGPLYLTGDPTQPLQAADKHYVDTSAALALPLTGGTVTGSLTAKQIGGAYQVDQFAGVDFGAKLQACLGGLNNAYGGTCDARNFSGNVSMASDLIIATANAVVMLPCATISTAKQIVVTAGTRNVSLRGCSLRGASSASGSQGGTVLLYSGSRAAVQVGDPTYMLDTPGFHLDSVLINVTASSSSNAQAIAAYRTQQMDLQSLYLLGNAGQTGITLDGTGNYTGGTFYDNHISGFQTAINGIGHQIANPAVTDWLNASTFIRLHINCPTNGGSPIGGTYGINLQQGDGNSFTGGDVEGCATALHLGANAQNNTIVGLRNENSDYQVVADAGSAYNNWMTGGTMYTGKLIDGGTRNSFIDTFHRSFNSLNGDWYGSQQDATVTNHFRLGIGNGNERGMLDRYQTDEGYRWTMGLSDATGGEQYYQVLDELNNVYRISVGQYNSGEVSTNNQTVINAAGTGAVVLNGSSNAGTGGVVFGSGGPNETTVATISNTGNAQFNGALQVGSTAQSAGTMTVRNNADAEVDYYLWPGLTTSQKGSFTYKDYNGNSQWFVLKDASNNWALNSALGGLDSFKAYQSTNSGDTYVNASNSTGVVRVNYENGSGTAFNIYGGSSGSLYASFSGTNAIKFPGLSASSGRNCLQIDSSGYISNTGFACGRGSGTVNSGAVGQIAYYNNAGTAVSGMTTVPISAGGTGATTAAAALSTLGAAALLATTEQKFAGPITASINSQINVMAPPYLAKGDGITDDATAINAACTAAKIYSPPAVVYFPKPSSKYLVSTLSACQGVSLLGQAPGLGNASGGAGVTIQGKPGKDILNALDPNTGTPSGGSGGGNWEISNIQFKLDDSLDASASFPHRWPGRWTQDGSITAGSAVLTSTKQQFTCSDVGVAVNVKGAGAAGADLITTITSLPSCNGVQTSATLATAASTNVSNGLVYVSIPGASATQTIGNCALSFDNYDGNHANWKYTPSTGYPALFNDSFVTTSGTSQNSSCAIYFQGQWSPYGIHADRVNIQRYAWAVVEGTTDTNPGQGAAGNDYQKWSHMLIQATHPWVSYNGTDLTVEDWQLDSAYGPYIGQVSSATEVAAGNWRIHVPEFENNTSGIGFVIKGNGHLIGDTMISAASGKGYVDASTTTCSGCLAHGALTMNGSGNIFQFGSNVDGLLNGGYINNGYGNLVTGAQVPNPYKGRQPTRHVNLGSSAVNPGSSSREPGYVGSQTTDFLTNGTAQAPFYNQQDLLFYPQDYDFNGFPFSIFSDSNSLSGRYVAITSSAGTQGFAHFNLNAPNAGAAIIGKQIPAQAVNIYDTAKCPAATSYTLQIVAGATQVASAVIPCTTTYTTHSISADLSAYAGQALNLNWSVTGEVDDSWSAVVPVNLTTISALASNTTAQNILQAGSGIVSMTAANWSFGGSPGATDSASPIGYSTTVSNAMQLSSWRGSANLKGGSLYAAVNSTVAAVVAGNAVWSDTLAAAMTSADTTMKITTPTTTAWPPTAYLMIDQEIVKATGVTAGQTTLAISRGQYGTLAQPHSNGSPYSSAGHGNLSISCSGTTYGLVNMVFGPVFTTWSGPFAGQNCSGSTTSFQMTGLGSDFAGQAYRIAAIDITQTPMVNMPTAANVVPVSTLLSAGVGEYTSNKPIAGSGAALVTGPSNGTVANHIATFSGSNGQIQDSGTALASVIPLVATTASLGGAALSAGQCTSGTLSITGATTSMTVTVSPATGNAPGSGFVWQGYVNAPGSVTVQLCAITAGTPAATSYNVRVLP